MVRRVRSKGKVKQNARISSKGEQNFSLKFASTRATKLEDRGNKGAGGGRGVCLDAFLVCLREDMDRRCCLASF